MEESQLSGFGVLETDLPPLPDEAAHAEWARRVGDSGEDPDVAAYRRARDEYETNPVSYSSEEVMAEFGLGDPERGGR